MYLKEIIINGFKSFADRTRLDLEAGVVAIVGPNGCGKSNIADAIRWVLGEQSAKALRGGRMEDVIFDGTDKRKRINLCEVTLTFSNCEKELGTAYNEVEIGRRVTREGSSEYFLNGKVCRLKDIQRLFMDTGVGRVSYSFLVQGQIDQILSSNPADRRVIFEEAAGITKYKAHRREAMNKLALVEGNLARVTDVIEEVSRQIGSLKRQASKALRYKKLRHRLVHLDQGQMAYRHGELQEEITRLEQEASEHGKALESAREENAEREAKLEAERSSRTELYNRMQEAQQKVYALRSEKENAENKAEFAALRRKDLEERVEELKQEIRDLREQQESLARKAADDTEVKQLQLDIVGSSDEAFQEKSREMFEAQDKLNRVENELQDKKQHLLMLESSITRLRSNQTSLEVDLKTYQVKHAGLQDTLQELENKKADMEERLGELERSREKLQRDYDAGVEEMESLREKSGGLRTEFRELQGVIQERDRELARNAAHLQVLENLNASFEGFGEGARAILQDKLESLLPGEKRRLLSAAIQVDEAYTPALEAILESAGDSIVVENYETAASVVNGLKAKKLGRACLQIPTPEGAEEEVSPVSPPSHCKPVLDVISLREGSPEERAARSLLGHSYFCEDLESFMEFWEQNPSFRFYRVATREGDVLDSRGLLYGGKSKGGQNSFLKRQNEIRTLKESITHEEKKLAELREKAAGQQEKMDELDEKVEQRRTRLTESGRELSNLSAQEKGLRDALFQNEAQKSSAREQIEKLKSTHGESARRLEEARSALKSAESEIEGQREAIKKVESSVHEAREERDSRREALADIRLQLAEKKQRLETIDRNLGNLEEKSRELHEMLIRREQELDTLYEQIEERKQEESAETAKAGEIEKTLKVVMESLEKDKDVFSRAEDRVKELEREQSRNREHEREKETALNRKEVKLAELRSRRGYLLERFQGEYHAEVDSIDWRVELWRANEKLKSRVDLDSLEEGEEPEVKPQREEAEPTEEALREMVDPDWSAIEEEVNHLKERIQSMGPVNLVAIEEYADLSQRYRFLKEQSDDLWNSKDSLLKAIDEINTTSRKLFQDTFEQVTKNFKFTYDQLTGGGFADLTLVDTEDVLDSGIEITARPPGTNLKSISLLSGGQKTMTAVALLFAIYMVKPSPFCVLDELDAPLDDANIGRFTEMLKRFTEYSQFLIITHNKRTIASADMIFGVTMPEKGISRLLSMHFNHERGVAEAAPEEAETLAATEV